MSGRPARPRRRAASRRRRGVAGGVAAPASRRRCRPATASAQRARAQQAPPGRLSCAACPTYAWCGWAILACAFARRPEQRDQCHDRDACLAWPAGRRPRCWAVGIYNGLVTARNAYKNAFAQIDVQLTRRHDLIPNLVEVAKGYMAHERETLEAVIKARAAAVSGLAARQGRPGRRRRDGEPRRRRAGPDRRAGPADGGQRGLPGPQGQPEHDAAVGGADLDREPRRLRAPGLQRLGDGLQQPPRGVPVQHRRRHVQLRRPPRCSRSTEPGQARGAQGHASELLRAPGASAGASPGAWCSCSRWRCSRSSRGRRGAAGRLRRATEDRQAARPPARSWPHGIVARWR